MNSREATIRADNALGERESGSLRGTAAERAHGPARVVTSEVVRLTQSPQSLLPKSNRRSTSSIEGRRQAQHSVVEEAKLMEWLK